MKWFLPDDESSSYLPGKALNHAIRLDAARMLAHFFTRDPGASQNVDCKREKNARAAVTKVIALLLAIAPLIFAAPLQARGYRGVQAILFMAWDDSSVDKFIQTVAAARPSLPSNRLELAVLYIPQALPKHADKSQRTRWDNIRRVIDCLATVPPPPGVACPAALPTAIDLKVRVFFGFHAFDGKTEAEDLKILRGRAAEFNTQLLRNYGDRIVFRLSPLLEESPAISYAKFAQAIFDQLDGSRVCSSIYPRLIRSGGNSPASVTVKVKCKPTDTSLASRTISVSLESHGKSPRSGFDSWSNDGSFVYHPAIESSSLTPNSDGVIDPVKLNDFIKDAKQVSGPALLWRPRYNLMLYRQPPGTRESCKNVRGTGPLGYCVTPSERGDIEDRIAKTGGAVFDDLEAMVLTTFLTAEAR